MNVVRPSKENQNKLIDHEFKHGFTRVNNQKNHSDCHIGASRRKQLNHADETFNIHRNKNVQQMKSMMIYLFTSNCSIFNAIEVTKLILNTHT